MADQKNTVDLGFVEGVATAVAHIRKGGEKQLQAAATVLLVQCSSRLRKYIRHSSFRLASDEDTEELLADTLMKFLHSPVPNDCVPEAWLFSMCRNLVRDWLRKRIAERRGGKDMTEVSLDDDELGSLFESMLGDVHLPEWVRICVHRAIALMQQERPERSLVLFMIAEGWSAKDIAIHFGAKDPNKVTEKELTAARDRKYRACQEARKYFEHCKE